MFFYFTILILIGSTLSSPLKKEKSYYDREKFYNHKYFEGDILSFPSNSLRYHAVTSDSLLWPNGEVVYQVDSSVDNGLILSAMDQIGQATGGCIKFREKQDGDSDYVNIFSGEGCYAEVGRKGGEQQLSLGQGCTAVGVYIHELLHTLGFYHHHSRSDRDDYLDIFWENIIPELASNFKKLESYENQLLTPFDYQSIMMYGNLAFSKDNVHYTMLPKEPSIQISDPGTKSSMTSLDITSLRKLYGCDSSPPSNDLEDKNDSLNEDKNGNLNEDKNDNLNEDKKTDDNQIDKNDDKNDKFGDNLGDPINDNDKSILPPIPKLNELPPMPKLPKLMPKLKDVNNDDLQINENYFKLVDLDGGNNLNKLTKNKNKLVKPTPLKPISLKPTPLKPISKPNLLPDLKPISKPNLLPDLKPISIESYDDESNNDLKINEFFGNYGELGNLVDLRTILSILPKIEK